MNRQHVRFALCRLLMRVLLAPSAVLVTLKPWLPRGPQLLHGPQLPCIFLASYIDMHMLSHRDLDLSDNKIKSLAGATFAGTIG
jgi:hypothetical protein